LKCAVHPMRAFSEEAIDCRDFERETRWKSRIGLSWTCLGKFSRYSHFN
jgi:hypothetical protein